MTRINIDPSLRAKLNGLSEPIELCDEGGHTLGHFLPVDVYKKLVYASIQIPLSEQEIERRRKETGGRSLAGIWKSLGQA